MLYRSLCNGFNIICNFVKFIFNLLIKTRNQIISNIFIDYFLYFVKFLMLIEFSQWIFRST